MGRSGPVPSVHPGGRLEVEVNPVVSPDGCAGSGRGVFLMYLGRDISQVCLC